MGKVEVSKLVENLLKMSIFVSCSEVRQRAISALHMSTLIIVLIKVSPTSWKLLRHYKKLQQYNEKVLYCGGMMICIITWIWTMNDIIIDIECINEIEFGESGIERIVYAAMYLIQLILLLLVFFLNIYYNFRETPWKLSRLSLRLYQLLFFLVCIICISIITTLDRIDMRLSILLSFIMIILIFSLMISLMVSYIHRLIGVYKINTNDDKLALLITKSTLLTCISLVITLCNTPLLALRVYHGGYTTEWLQKFMISFDVISNYLLIVMSYPLFDSYYKQLCGGLDSKCKNYLRRMIDDANSDEDDLNIISLKSGDDTQQYNIYTLEMLNEEDTINLRNDKISAFCHLIASIYSQTRCCLFLSVCLCKVFIFVLILIMIIFYSE